MTGPDAARREISAKNPMLPIKIFWSSRSPFVRKTMMAIHEMGLGDYVTTEATLVTGSQPTPTLEPVNPLGQIPTVVLADGTVIYDSDVIIDFLDAHFNDRKFLPVDFPRRLDVLKRTALCKGIKEKGIRGLHERWRPKALHDPAVMEGHHRSMGLALDALEADAPRWTKLPMDLGHISTATTLGWLDFRFDKELSWRNGRPNLNAFHAEFAKRPSYTKTEFVDSRPAAMIAEAGR